MPREVSRTGVLPFLYGSAPGLRVADAGHVVGTRSPQTLTHRSSSEPVSSKRPSPMGRLAASLPRLGGVGEPIAPSRAASSSFELGGPVLRAGTGHMAKAGSSGLHGGQGGHLHALFLGTFRLLVLFRSDPGAGWGFRGQRWLPGLQFLVCLLLPQW